MKVDFFFNNAYDSINNLGSDKKSYIKLEEKYNRSNTLKNFYNIYLNQVNQNTSISQKLFKSFIKFFLCRYLIILLIRIYTSLADVVGPILMGKILGTTNTLTLSEDEKYICYLLIFIFILINFLRIILGHYYEYNLKIFRHQIEFIISDLVYNKIINLRNGNKIDSKITRLFDEDIRIISDIFMNINYLWELPFSIMFALYATYLQVSYSFFPGLIFAILLLYVNYKIAINITRTNEELNDPRLNKKNYELIAIKNIKSIKYFSMEKYFLDKIYYFRKNELKLLTFKKYLDALCCYLWAATPILISFCSIFSYLITGNLIDAEKVFTTISLLNNIIHPLNVFPWIFSSLKRNKTSFGNFCEIMNKKEILTIEKGDSIILQDIAFKYKQKSDFALKIENEFIVKEGDITIIYGVNGSGKTLLLKGILNECIIIKEKDSKYIIPSNISYVPQELWTFNETILENICLGKHDEEYKSVLDMCELNDDLNTMTKGDQTVISTKCSNISGGQKQRINIARAIKNKSKYIIFDNSFSSIDSNVASKIFENSIIPLRKQGYSIIIATSDKKWFKYSESIYIIENKTLRKAEKDDIENNYLNYNYSNDDFKIQDNKKVEDEKTIIENQHVKLNTYIFYFKNTGIVFFIFVILFVALMQFGRNFIEIWLANWVKADNLTDQEKFLLQNRNMKLYIIFVLIHSVFTALRSERFATAGLRACKKIYETFINKLIYSKINFYLNNDIGKLSNLLQLDINTIDEWLPFEFNRLLAYSFGLIGSIIVISYSSPYLILLFIIFSFYYIGLFKTYNPAIKNLNKDLNEINANYLNLFYDTVSGKSIIRAHQDKEYFINKFNNLLEKRVDIMHTSRVIGYWLSIRLDLLAFYIYSFVISAIGICIYRDKYELITFFSLALTYALNITSPLSSFLPWVSYTEEQFLSVERVNNKIEEMEEESNADEEFLFNNKPIIQFDKVNMKYDKTNNCTLNDISFQIYENQKIGIIGRTGSGKSSLISLLIRLYDKSEGEIKIYGRDIEKINTKKLREIIVVIPKENLILNGSIKENLDIDNIYSVEYLNEFMLKFDEILKKNEFSIFYKLDFMVTSNNLSEGQKSLIQILRGLLKKPKILCLDESNAELDDETERILFDIILNKFSNITFIVIAHKLNILRNFDTIIVLDHGKIKEINSPNNILNI